MSAKSSKSRGDSFAELNSRATLRWLEACIASARYRREERLVALLELVKAEMTFEEALTNQKNRPAAESTNEDCQRKSEEIENQFHQFTAKREES